MAASIPADSERQMSHYWLIHDTCTWCTCFTYCVKPVGRVGVWGGNTSQHSVWDWDHWVSVSIKLPPKTLWTLSDVPHTFGSAAHATSCRQLVHTTVVSCVRWASFMQLWRKFRIFQAALTELTCFAMFLLDSLRPLKPLRIHIQNPGSFLIISIL